MKAIVFCEVQAASVPFTLIGVHILHLSFMTIMFPKAEHLKLTGKNKWEKNQVNIHSLIKDGSICVQDYYTYITISLTETL